MSTGIIVMGHGHFATGITSALELIMGSQPAYEALDFPALSKIVLVREKPKQERRR